MVRNINVTFPHSSGDSVPGSVLFLSKLDSTHSGTVMASHDSNDGDEQDEVDTEYKVNQVVKEYIKGLHEEDSDCEQIMNNIGHKAVSVLSIYTSSGVNSSN